MRTRAITRCRALSSAPSGTSVCRAAATRRSNQSDTRYLLKQGAQPRERALNAHLERRFSGTGDSGHLFVGQVVGVLEHDRFALLRRQLLEHVLERLPAEQREAIVLKYADDLTYEEMSRITGAGESALKMRVQRAFARLRAMLQEVPSV